MTNITQKTVDAIFEAEVRYALDARADIHWDHLAQDVWNTIKARTGADAWDMIERSVERYME